MTSQTLLLIANKETSDETISQIADTAYASSSHLTCLLLGHTPRLPAGVYGAWPYAGAAIAAEDWPRLMQQSEEEMEARTTQIEAVLSRNAVSGEVQPVLCATADISHAVSQRAIISDAAYIAPNLREEDDMLTEAVQGVLFQSPIGLFMNAPVLSGAKRVFLAWDSGLAAARAAHMALPNLQGASEVVVGCFDMSTAGQEDPGVDLAKWLSHHGCTVTVNQYSSGGQPVGDCISQRAAEIGADLIVMGAYGRSRLRQTVFGGTTRTMLEQTDIPVFLAH